MNERYQKRNKEKNFLFRKKISSIERIALINTFDRS
jgi:hypothetical protein